MKKLIILAFFVLPTFLFGQQVFKSGGSGSSVNSAAVGAQISDSLNNLTLGVDIATSADSVLVMNNGKLKIMSKAEFLADIYSALNQMSGLDLTAPTIDSIEVGRYNDSIFVAFFHESDTHVDSIPPVSAFNLTEGGVTVGLDTILFSATGDSMMVVMDSLAEYGATYLFDYTKTYTHVQDSSGNDLASFSNMAVSNYVSEPAPPPTNMLSNGTFDSATGWGVTGGWSITGGAAVYATTGSGELTQASASMVSPILPNTSYTLTFDCSGTSGGGILMKITSLNTGDGAIDYVAAAEYTNGAKSVTFTTPADINDGGFRLYAYSYGDSGATIDNLVLMAD